ncbi:MAG: hypothetical protein ACLFQV_10850 [Vulcanimicrobiota bacterium]
MELIGKSFSILIILGFLSFGGARFQNPGIPCANVATLICMGIIGYFFL